MSGYRDVKLTTTTTVSSGAGGSAWGSGVFRNDISSHDSQENLRFVDDHDRRPVEKNGFNVQKVCIVACSLLVVTTIIMGLIDTFISSESGNVTNVSNSTQLLSV